MKLFEIIKSVKEENLSQNQLEAFRDELSHLFAQIQIETADLEKEEALFMADNLESISVAERKVRWKATKSGQRLIELKRYALATKEILQSLKSRLYNFY